MVQEKDKLRVFLSIQLLRNIRDRTRWDDPEPWSTTAFNVEGWKVTVPEGATFARVAEFKDESAKVFFMLKYGG